MVAAGGKLAMKRGRPPAGDVAQIEGAILSTARHLFLTQGFEGVSMEKVAAGTGITRATLYNRYASKVALFHAVIRSTIADRFAGGRAAVVDDATDLAAILRLRVSDMAGLLVDPLFRALHSLILSNRHRFPELGPMMHDIGYRPAVELLVNDITAAASRDAVPVRRPEMIAEHILTAIHGWFLQYDLVRELNAAEIEAYGHGVVELVMLSRDRW